MSESQTLPPTPPQRIGVAADHGGFELKEYLAVKLRDSHYEVFDFGDGHPNRCGACVFEVEINLHGLDSATTKVELYADEIDGGGAVRQEMEPVGQLAGPSNGCKYRTRVCATRPATGYTARLIPNYTGVAIAPGIPPNPMAMTIKTAQPEFYGYTAQTLSAGGTRGAS